MSFPYCFEWWPPLKFSRLVLTSIIFMNTPSSWQSPPFFTLFSFLSHLLSSYGLQLCPSFVSHIVLLFKCIKLTPKQGNILYIFLLLLNNEFGCLALYFHMTSLSSDSTHFSLPWIPELPLSFFNTSDMLTRGMQRWSFLLVSHISYWYKWNYLAKGWGETDVPFFVLGEGGVTSKRLRNMALIPNHQIFSHLEYSCPLQHVQALFYCLYTPVCVEIC